MSRIDNCEDAVRLLAAYMDQELNAAARERLEHHLETCRSCYSRAEFEKRLKASMAELGRAPVRPELAERVQTLIRTFPAGTGG
ncbi:MAG TPA: anti-sigma factor [Longimicrobiales bacterium]|nr:anti-sigma factor [Longimicrobiales bacterium]